MAPLVGPSSWTAVFLAVLLACVACDDRKPRGTAGRVAASASSRSGGVARPITPERTSTAPTASAAPPPEAQNEPAEDEPPRKGAAAGLRLGSSRLVIDELVDVAPAGPSAATPTGVLLLLRDGRPVFAPLSRQPIRLTQSQRTPVTALEVDPAALVALEHGPVVAGGHTYFVQNGHLLRRKLPDGAIEDLASDARSYTRVAVPDRLHADLPMVVGYIARHPTERETLLAKLWIEGQPNLQLTPEGSAGNSVTIGMIRGGYVAISLESRTGMSPLHARRVVFERGRAELGPDVVPWIAGTAQPLTEIYSVSDHGALWAILPIERDATHFGLARIHVGEYPQMDAQVHWREYPNGLDPAVVATGHLCKEPVVVYARPSSAAPRATQELHLSGIGEAGLGPSVVLATSRAFADASLAGLDDGALVVYVADRRTWARRLRCVPG